jgi:hypothetical protein
MKSHRLLSIILFSLITILTACTNTNYPSKPLKYDLLGENWIPQVNLNSTLWTRGADNWFFTGEPNQIERAANSASPDKAMTIIAVKVPQFTDVTVQGCFQVQIDGGQEHNSVFILGANDAVRGTVVQVSGNKILIAQRNDDKSQTIDFSKVIVRIGIRNLRNFTVGGGAKVEGHNVMSDGLIIRSTNPGNILLSGNMKVLNITNMGSGTISILGANTPCLDINSLGGGTVNVCGRIGIRTINNKGGGAVSVIGADSKSLTVNAEGGFTSVAGYVNLRKITATNNSCVLIYWVNSNGAYVFARDTATVGLAGNALMENINLTHNARFLGQYLHGGNIFVQTQNNAHANVSTNQKLFASASDTSSIYYFGTPAVSPYITGNGVVIPVWNGSVLPMPQAPTFRMVRGPTVSK